MENNVSWNQGSYKYLLDKGEKKIHYDDNPASEHVPWNTVESLSSELLKMQLNKDLHCLVRFNEWPYFGQKDGLETSQSLF